MVREPWERAWDREKHTVGRLVHEAWMAEKQRQGFADHAWPRVGPPGEKYDWPERRGPCWVCVGEDRPDRAHHHPDMVPYDELAPENQAYDWASGEVGFRAGFEAAHVGDFTDLETEVMLRCLDNCGSAWSSPDDSDIGRLRSKLRALRAKLEGQ